MIPQSAKAAAKQLAQKGEVSPERKNSRIASKSNLSTCKPNSETLFSSKSSSNTSPPDVAPKLCRSRPKENHYPKLLELTSRDPASHASQGVQDFMKEVSRFIEKKNPFKVPPQKKCFPDPVRSENHYENQTLRDEPRNFGFDKNSACSKFKKNTETPKRISERVQVSNDNRVERGPRNFPEVAKAEDAKGARRYVGGTSSSKKDLKEKSSLKIVSSTGKFEGWNNEGSPSTVKQDQTKRPRRSEIPLRKTRMDMSRNPKPISLLMRKPLKEAESAISIDFHSKKPFTPIEELRLCFEIQNNNVTAGSEKLNHVATKSSPRTPKNDIPLEEAKNGCLKNLNIPIISNPSWSEIPDRKLCMAERSKVLDLDKMRTSSFTVLQNNKKALCRLESLHQQNVSTKQDLFGEKFSSSKLKVLTPKPSFSLLKGKSSKKNLEARLSSKGNKPGLKIKTRKSKNDIDEGSVMLIQSQKANVNQYFPAVWNDEELAFGKVGESSSRTVFSHESAVEELSKPMSSQIIPKKEFEDRENEFRTSKNSGKKASKHFGEGGLEDGKRKGEEEFPPAPPQTLELAMEGSSPEERQTDEDERSSSKTVTLGRPVMDEASSLSSEDSQTQFRSSRQTSSKKCEKSGLVVKGTSLKFGKDEPPEKPEGSEPKKNKLQIKINLNTPEDTDCEENANSSESLDRLHLNCKNHSAEQLPHEEGSSEVGNEKEEEGKCTRIASTNLPSKESTGKEQFVLAEPQFCKSPPLLRNRLQYKVSGANLKGVRKKKIRSDAGDRRLPSSTGFFKSISLQNKIKLDTKLRSGLTKSYAREEKRDLFDDNVPIKLKRRNSEPISFRGYIWKRADSVTPRAHKPSVSSMASSLKHLNTDDIDDFIFWEAVPQKMTSCWEMSLYHFKRPWSVLSCSVFEDNRQSSTPGLILENLRNGGTLSPRRSALNSNERVNRSKDNPFDVEPSIAQKNIDIRNWLAALNFPTPPSTSIDFISEGNFSAHSSFDAQSLSKDQVGQKRRKVLASLRFSEGAVEKKADDKETKYKKSTKWNASEVGGLMDLIRRKSGGFVTNEQFFNSEHSIHRPNVTVNLCLYSKASEEKPPPRVTNDRSISSEPKTFKTDDNPPSPKNEKSTLMEPPPNAAAQPRCLPKAGEKQLHWARLLKGDLALLPSDLNIWKYLFLFTVFIISVHYYFLNNNVGRG